MFTDGMPKLEPKSLFFLVMLFVLLGAFDQLQTSLSFLTSPHVNVCTILFLSLLTRLLKIILCVTIPTLFHVTAQHPIPIACLLLI